MSKKIRNRLPDGRRAVSRRNERPRKHQSWTGLIIVGLLVAVMVIMLSR